MHSEIQIIGCGISGSECAMYLVSNGIDVVIREMRPLKMTPAHNTGYFGELVCSNSLKSMEKTNAHGLLKKEMKELGSKIIEYALENRIPGGKALVVDREKFSKTITEFLESNCKVIREEVVDIDSENINVIATGPLTSEKFSRRLKKIVREKNLYYYDAISPIVSAESINFNYAFWGSRYREDNDYLNCPLTREEYERLVSELSKAEKHKPHIREDEFFHSCLPVEEIARRGRESLRFSHLKPLGLTIPERFKNVYAVVQLRRENVEGTMFNMVGFQTRLKTSEQERVFRIIPALQNANFLRFGKIHRNTYINSPKLLDKFLRLNNNTFVVGALTGVEGYMESAITGLYVGINIARILNRKKPVYPPKGTLLEGLLNYILSKKDKFLPMNVNLGLLRNCKTYDRELIAENSIEKIKKWRKKYGF